MTRLIWDARDHDIGLERGVLYLPNASGVAWSGLTSVNETPSNSGEQTRYIDGVMTDSHRRRDDFSGVIEAFTYPDSFFDDVLTQRRQPQFGLSYRTQNEIHLVYNMLVAPSSFNYQQMDTQSFSWAFTTTPIPIPGARSCAHLIVNAAKAYSWTVSALEDILYGSDSVSSRLPLPLEVLDIFESNSILRVVDNGDGTATITGPDEAIQALDATTYQITWPSVIQLDPVTYKISSL
jgi:hypothetical protein